MLPLILLAAALAGIALASSKGDEEKKTPAQAPPAQLPAAAGPDPLEIVRAAIASGSTFTMRGAVTQLRSLGFEAAAVQLEAAIAKMPAETPDWMSQIPMQGVTAKTALDPVALVRNALASGSRDAVLATAKQLRDAGLNDSATQLETAAAKMGMRGTEDFRPTPEMEGKTAPALDKTPPVVFDSKSPGLPQFSQFTQQDPTSAAIAAKKAADVVNKAAEVIADPSGDAVKAAAKAALDLASSAPPQAQVQARAVLEAANQALATPDAATMATLARASTELAKALATPATAPAAEVASQAAKTLETSPTAANASNLSAVVAKAAASAIKESGAPIAEPGRTTYVVQKGDNPWGIAQKITGNGNRYPELVKANSKPYGSKTVVPVLDANKQWQGKYTFTSLGAGEVLKLPATWVSAAPASTVQPGGTTAPGWVEDFERMKNENPSLYDSAMKVKTSTDPAVLMRASELVRTKYPNLGIAFAFWAEQAKKGAAPGGTPVSQAAVAIPASTTALPPTSAPTTYTVQKGDSPWKIAQKLSGTGLRWKELVAANPTKKRAADGSFATLNAGEVLKVPSSWANVTPMTVGVWPRPARTLSGMGMAPAA
jgi:nucleoid-associated protein YgaU